MLPIALWPQMSTMQEGSLYFGCPYQSRKWDWEDFIITLGYIRGLTAITALKWEWVRNKERKKRAPVQSGRATLGTVIWFQQQKVGKCRSGLCSQRPSLLEGLASPWLPPLPLNTSNLNKGRSSHLAGSPSPPKTQKPCCFLCLERFPPFA